MQTKIIAHRGASAYAPENTMAAFKLAIEQGADGLELDVHLTKDGEVVVAHDLRLERVSDGVGRICDFTLAELRQLNFNKTFPDSPACVLPTLAEVYALVADTELVVNVELKTTEELYPDMPKKLIELEQACGMAGRVIYSSFNHYSLLALRQFDPNADIGLLYELGMVDPWVYAKYVAAGAIHPHHHVLLALPETIAHCHECGIRVHPWTVDDPRAMGFLMQARVDMLITNKPDVAYNVRAGK